MLEKVTHGRKGATARTGGTCSVLRACLCSPGAWAESATVLSHLHNYLPKSWHREMERTLLMYPEVKSDYGQSVHKVLEEWILDIREKNSAERDVTKQKRLVSPLCKASGTWYPCDFVLLEPDSRLRKSLYKVVMFYLDWFPKRREAVMIALGSSG